MKELLSIEDPIAGLLGAWSAGLNLGSALLRIALIVALALACRRLVEQGLVEKMPVVHYVSGVSAGIVEDTAVLDPAYQEDSRAQVDLNCIMNELGEIIEIQGTGEGRAFTLKEQQELVELCAKGNRELQAKQKEIIGEL